MAFNLRKIVNFCITFEIKSWLFYAGNGFTLRNYLLGVVNLTKKDADINRYSYSGYGI